MNSRGADCPVLCKIRTTDEATTSLENFGKCRLPHPLAEPPVGAIELPPASMMRDRIIPAPRADCGRIGFEVSARLAIRGARGHPVFAGGFPLSHRGARPSCSLLAFQVFGHRGIQQRAQGLNPCRQRACAWLVPLARPRRPSTRLRLARGRARLRMRRLCSLQPQKCSRCTFPDFVWGLQRPGQVSQPGRQLGYWSGEGSGSLSPVASSE
jgi:hypothetical protein